MEVKGKFKVGSEEFNDGYVASPGQNAEEISENYAKRRMGFLEAQIETEKSLPNDKLKQSGPQTAALKRASNNRTLGPIQVSETTLQGNKSDLQELINEEDTIISEASLLAEQEIKAAQEEDAGPANRSVTESSSAEPTFSAQAATPSWVPDYGSTTVRKVTSSRATDPIGTPYAFNRLIWYDNPGFGRYEPYEHDFFLYNYDRATLLRPGQSSYPGCFPNVYYSTNYPASAEPYLDSRAKEPPAVGCEVDEKAYTIGALRADNLKANQVYQVYVSTGKTNVGRDKWKLQAQKQIRAPGCSSALCITSNGTRTLVPAWSPAPTQGLFW